MRREFCSFPKYFRIEEILRNQDRLQTLFEEEGVMAAYLFGSLAEGGVGGDADIAVLFERYSFEAYEDLYEALCRLLKADNIDLIPLNRTPLPLRRRILLKGILLYERTPGITTRLLEALLADWEDYLHLTAVLRTSLRARIQGGDTMSGRRVDRERVEISLSKLDEMVTELAHRREAFHSFDEFMAERDQRELCVHYLRIALECVLDICRHFVAVKGASLAEIDTTNLIELAGEKGLMPPSFARRIRGMAGMRNAIVHIYWKLDYAAIYQMLTERLGDFQEFSRHVWAFLEGESATS
ncbi:MAG: type VII toxin-antitoxin system HepT family RNase toxin [Candidatus Methylomirabilales bacterium]